MEAPSKQILAQYTRDALSILDHSILLYDEGQESFYRVVAAQLRILLCDTTFRHNKQVEIAIVPQLFPDFKLCPIDDLGRPRLNLPPLDLAVWLDSQAAAGSGLSIRQLIRRVCDIDGGAHVDLKPLAGLPENGNTRQWIINLARYLSPLLAQELSGNQESHSPTSSQAYSR